MKPLSEKVEEQGVAEKDSEKTQGECEWKPMQLDEFSSSSKK